MSLSNSKQFNHLFLKEQGIRALVLKASITSCESVSNQRLSHPFEKAISIAVKAATSSASKGETVSTF